MRRSQSGHGETCCGYRSRVLSVSRIVDSGSACNSGSSRPPESTDEMTWLMATYRGLLKITKLLRDLVLLVSIHEDGPDDSATAAYCGHLVHSISCFRINAETYCQHRPVCPSTWDNNINNQLRCCRQVTRHQPAASSVHYTTSCKHSLVLLKMGQTIARNMSR